MEKVRAWSVHFYAGLGLVINMYSIHAALYASHDTKEQADANFNLFARLNGLVILVDATGGPMARRWNVKKHASSFDGALLDNIIGFQTYSLLPALAVCIFEEVPGRGLQYAVAGCILVSSGYQFCQTSAKTVESFVGFPSYWNLVLVYVHYLQPALWVRCSMFFGFSILSFLPIHFVYPKKTKKYFSVTMTGAYLWGALIVTPTIWPEWEYSVLCMKLSLLYVFYYFGLSFYFDYLRRATTRDKRKKV